MKRTILFVDNDHRICARWEKLLQQEGYKVRVATTSDEAQSELKQGAIDLAIIDARLNDKDPDDKSGLDLAASPDFDHIPKIIYTAYQWDIETQRKVLESYGDRPPKVLAFVGKDEKPEILLEEIRQAIKSWARLNLLSSNVIKQIQSDQATVRSQARWHFAFSVAVSIVGSVLIFISIVFSKGWSAAGILGTISGLILNVMGYFFARLDIANQRVDLYHRELLQTHGLEFLISVLAEHLPAEQANQCIERAVDAVVKSWYPPGTKSGLVQSNENDAIPSAHKA